MILVLVGLGWAFQGAGIVGGSSLMDNNPTFLYFGGFPVVLGAALVSYGTTM